MKFALIFTIAMLSACQGPVVVPPATKPETPCNSVPPVGYVEVTKEMGKTVIQRVSEGTAEMVMVNKCDGTDAKVAYWKPKAGLQASWD